MVAWALRHAVQKIRIAANIKSEAASCGTQVGSNGLKTALRPRASATQAMPVRIQPANVRSFARSVRSSAQFVRFLASAVVSVSFAILWITIRNCAHSKDLPGKAGKDRSVPAARGGIQVRGQPSSAPLQDRTQTPVGVSHARFSEPTGQCDEEPDCENHRTAAP